MTEQSAEPTSGALIGRRIAAARKRLGWSQQQLAIQAGVERSWIASLEAGNTEDPGVSRVLLVARAVGADPLYLQTGVSATHESPDVESVLRRLRSRFTSDQLTRFEQAMISFYFNADSATSQVSDDEGQRDGPEDAPDAGPEDDRAG